MIRRNVETEARLVDDLLDLTRIARGKVQLHFEVVDAHASLRNAVAMFQKEIRRERPHRQRSRCAPSSSTSGPTRGGSSRCC